MYTDEKSKNNQAKLNKNIRLLDEKQFGETLAKQLLEAMTGSSSVNNTSNQDYLAVIKLATELASRLHFEQLKHLQEQHQLARSFEENKSLTDSQLIGKIDDVLENIKSDDFNEQHLDLTDRDLNDEDIIELAKLLSNKRSVTALLLKGNSISDDGAKALANISHLKYLDLTDNQIGASGAKYLANSNLETLILTGNQTLENNGAIALSKSKTIKNLNISGCWIGDTGASAILSNAALEWLDISSNQIGDDGIENIKDNTNLLEVNFSSNNIKHNGAKAISLNTYLKKVSLDSNFIDDTGAIFLADSKSISELRLVQNQIGEKGFLALCKNPLINKLSLISNNVCFSQHAALPLAKALKDLDLTYNKIKNEPIEPLKSLRNFPALEKLGLAHNELGKQGALIFTNIEKTTLKEVDLQGENVPPELSFISKTV